MGSDTEVTTDSELTLVEQAERLYLEKIFERSFYEAGKALVQLRDRRLYRSTHRTFEEYCKERFGYSTHRQPYLLIEAAAVVDNLLEKYDPLDHILPTNERQVRPLTKLLPDDQCEAWQMAVEEAGKKVPTSSIVQDIVQRIKNRNKVLNFNRVGEVCQIIPKDNPELKGKSGCWCIVTGIGDGVCTVTTWENEYVVRPENIKSFDYLEEECAFMQQLCLRLKKFQSFGNLDDAAYWILKGLGKLSTPYLTPLQQKLLNVLEQEYNE
ncbi:MAG: hypothetical protein KME33_12580 [Aetokthonos hydrillicola CCALA 1050]|nr:hypothetical protein [Aetokthonos hydrillicola CCALA 1050]MBW4586027.1 hypothetical protein [Aetokthonos hydrillicola CCALA 1050]